MTLPLTVSLSTLNSLQLNNTCFTFSLQVFQIYKTAFFTLYGVAFSLNLEKISSSFVHLFFCIFIIAC